MTISAYSASVPVFTRLLTALLSIMEKAEAYAAERKFDVDVLVEDRLYPDMNPFRFQIQSATDHTKFAASRLTGRTPPSWPDEEKTFGELKARVHKALDYLAGFSEADFEGADTREIQLTVGGQPRTVTGEAYFLGRALPNFYFHYTTAYDILRKNGVPVGKRDFLG
ncbi:MAG TPA: DUF1993 domain-containing protein [Devosia sp.]|nr:DUF1993 domain-containing protein [Devosia sp.]